MQATTYIRSEQAAALLGISPRTLVNWREKKIVPYRQVGHVILFRADELDAALSRFRVGAVGEPKTKAAK